MSNIMKNRKLVVAAIETMRSYSVAIEKRETNETAHKRELAAKNAFKDLMVSYGADWDNMSTTLWGMWITILTCRKECVVVPSSSTCRKRLRWVCDSNEISYHAEESDKPARAPKYTWEQWLAKYEAEKEAA